RELPRLGYLINGHASLLPRHRGAAPAAHAILAGDAVTGVTLFRIVRQLDAGPIVAQVEVEIAQEETAGELNARLSLRAAELLEETLPLLEGSSITETPQDSARATMAPKLEKEMALIDWSVEPETFCRRVRAFLPWPVAYSYLARLPAPPERTSILKAAVGDVAAAAGEPGTVVQVSKSGFQVACGDGSVRILEIQRAGKVSMDAAAYLCGRRLRVGDRFTRSSEGDSP
ncbi:MAG: methionyl-tRNA formyltransferase, partial [Planctomycetes bacterium]|nr:methionyl-tRNA formyltransferase [Planctomycetota bacterium]